ncbi:MAG TPA: riboflavin synthase [Actinomycetota bacterium]|jgi:riboflavin synthase|nr:riboflavin synthase [Actinomycetota bacterium]
MFTGIVEELGRVRALDGTRLWVWSRTAASDARPGASVAVNGVCLTVVGHEDGALAFDLSEETLRRTALRRLTPDAGVNLERPVTMATRLGGHLVQGHVDGVGEVLEVGPDRAGGAWLRVGAPAELMPYLVEKGSVAVDGVSLTVTGLDPHAFAVALIPHTLAVTTFGSARPGDPVNLEVDVIAKYIAQHVARYVSQYMAEYTAKKVQGIVEGART